ELHLQEAGAVRSYTSLEVGRSPPTRKGSTACESAQVCKCMAFSLASRLGNAGGGHPGTPAGVARPAGGAMRGRWRRRRVREVPRVPVHDREKRSAAVTLRLADRLHSNFIPALGE